MAGLAEGRSPGEAMSRVWPVRIIRGVFWWLLRRNRLTILAASPEDSDPTEPAGFSRVRIGPGAPASRPGLVRAGHAGRGGGARFGGAPAADGDEFFGWMIDGRVVSFGWVTYRDRRIGPVPLKDAPGRVFLYNFYTLDVHRGRDLYPALLRTMRRELGREGAIEFIIDVNDRNVASARGIEKAGFAAVTRITYHTLLNFWDWTVRVDRRGTAGRLL